MLEIYEKTLACKFKTTIIIEYNFKGIHKCSHASVPYCIGRICVTNRFQAYAMVFNFCPTTLTTQTTRLCNRNSGMPIIRSSKTTPKNQSMYISNTAHFTPA